jgi:hypothetical protein
MILPCLCLACHPSPANLSWSIKFDGGSLSSDGGILTLCEVEQGLRVADRLRQTHPAGERLFVDYACDGVPVVIDRLSKGQTSPAAAARFRLSWIVLRATPRRRPISRALTPSW